RALRGGLRRQGSLPPRPVAQCQLHRRAHLPRGRGPGGSDGEVLAMRSPLFVAPLLALLSVLAPGRARADAATEAKLRDALRSTTAQLHALEDERVKWKETETQLRHELETLRAQPAPKNQDKTVASLNRRLSEQNAATLRLREALDICRASTPGKAVPPPTPAEAAGEADPAKLAPTAPVKKLNERLATAETQNAELYQVGKDLIDWLVQIGVGGEPFLGWKRVELENVAQSYQEKLHEHRIGS